MTLNTGETLYGPLVDNRDATVTLTHAILGEMRIAKSDLSAYELRDPAPLPVKQDPQPAAPATQPKSAPWPVAPTHEEPAAPWFRAWFLPGFDKSVEVGFNGTRGNTRTLNLHLRSSANYRDDIKRWNLSSAYKRERNEDRITRNEAVVKGQRDWLFDEQSYFVFTQGEYEYDQFTDFKHRIEGYVGAGRNLIESKDWLVTGRVGAGAQYEFGEINDMTPELFLFGTKATWRITARQSAEAFNDLLVMLDQIGAERNVTGLAWKIDISEGDGLSLKLGFKNEYDVESVQRRNDFKYFGTLALDF